VEVSGGRDEYQDSTAFNEKAPSFFPSAQLIGLKATFQVASILKGYEVFGVNYICQIKWLW